MRDRCVFAHTSMYETSTVKLTLESCAFFDSTRSNSSEQVKGMIPLSAPSMHQEGQRDVSARVGSRLTAHHTRDNLSKVSRQSNEVHMRTYTTFQILTTPRPRISIRSRQTIHITCLPVCPS